MLERNVLPDHAFEYAPSSEYGNGDGLVGNRAHARAVFQEHGDENFLRRVVTRNGNCGKMDFQWHAGAQDVIHVNGAFVRTGTQLVGFLKGNDSVGQLGFLARLVKELAQALFCFLIQRLVPALNK